MSRWRYRGPSGKRTDLTLGGRDYTFRSSLEARIGEQLTEEKTQFDYESEKLPYVIEAKYTPDFILKKADGTPMYIEVKGYFTPEDRRKILAVREANPGIDLRFVFSSWSTKLRKGSKTTYGGWCEKHGFLFAQGLVPVEWTNE